MAFGEQAIKDGFAQVGKLFRTVAAVEAVHAHAHPRTMGGAAEWAAEIRTRTRVTTIDREATVGSTARSSGTNS